MRRLGSRPASGRLTRESPIAGRTARIPVRHRRCPALPRDPVPPGSRRRGRQSSRCRGMSEPEKPLSIRRASMVPVRPKNCPTSLWPRGIEPRPGPSPGTGVSSSIPAQFRGVRIEAFPWRRAVPASGKVSMLQTSNASGMSVSATMPGSAMLAPWPDATSSTCIRLRRTACRSTVGVFPAHVRVAGQHDRVFATLPGEHLKAIHIVEIVGSLALRDVAPGSGHMASRVHVLQEVQGERLVEQHRAGELAPFLGRKLRACEGDSPSAGR